MNSHSNEQVDVDSKLLKWEAVFDDRSQQAFDASVGERFKCLNAFVRCLLRPLI